jgi:hypothetical protein
MNDGPESNYAEVNGLEMYYEIHGSGEPLVLLHGAYMTIGTMGEIVPSLAETQRIIAVELQGHGRTADIDRPLSYEQMADDVAALLRPSKCSRSSAGICPKRQLRGSSRQSSNTPQASSRCSRSGRTAG